MQRYNSSLAWCAPPTSRRSQRLFRSTCVVMTPGCSCSGAAHTSAANAMQALLHVAPKIFPPAVSAAMRALATVAAAACSAAMLYLQARVSAASFA